MADKKISQLDLVAQINNDAVIPMSQENGGEQTTYKALITAIGAKIAEGLTFSNLATTAKNLVGAINEIEAGGGGGGAAILIGTTAPSSSQGSNGNLYIQYTAGTGGADDTVDAVFIKLDGTWCEITTDYADLLNKPQVNGNTLSGNKSNSDLGIYGKTINMSSTDPDKVADRIEALETSVSGLSTVATSGSYNDLLNKPTIPTVQVFNRTDVLLNTDGGTLRGFGSAMVTLCDGIARIDFNILISVDETVTGINTWGINRDYFTALTGKTITPIAGGVVTYYNSEQIYTSRMDFGGTFQVTSQFWKPARVYDDNGTKKVGGWTSGHFTSGQRMIGTCYGTYT